jgi:hypothetical protein
MQDIGGAASAVSSPEVKHRALRVEKIASVVDPLDLEASLVIENDLDDLTRRNVAEQFRIEPCFP